MNNRAQERNFIKSHLLFFVCKGEPMPMVLKGIERAMVELAARTSSLATTACPEDFQFARGAVQNLPESHTQLI